MNTYSCLVIFNNTWNKLLLLNRLHIRHLIRISEDHDIIDPYNFNIMMQLYGLYKNKIKILNKLNKESLYKKITNDMFPSDIYTNIAKYALETVNIHSVWDTDVCDLLLNNYKIKVKGFISNRPITFMSTEVWDNIIFVDFREIYSNKIKVYLINLSNKSKIWKKIKVSLGETFYNKYINNKRCAITFDNLFPQINEKYVYKIYEGTIKELELFW